MIKRLLEWGIVAVWLVSVLLINRFPGGLWWYLLASALIEIVLIFFLEQEVLKNWHYYFPWFLGAQASLVFYIFIDRSFLRNIWIAIIGIEGILYWYKVGQWQNSLVAKFQNSSKEILPIETHFSAQEKAMSDIGITWLMIAIGASGISLYACQVFIGLNVWILLLWLLALLSLSTFNVWKLMGWKTHADITFYLGSAVIVGVEFFWIIGFLTLGFISKGYIWASGIWYMWWLFNMYKNKTAAPERVIKGTVILFFSWIILLLATRWF